MNKNAFVIAAVVLGLSAVVAAVILTRSPAATAPVAAEAVAPAAVAAKANVEVVEKDAATRYAEDRKLCAEETSSSVRMQCLRDAKAEYDKSPEAAKKVENRQAATAAVAPAPKPVNKVCAECGKVMAVNVVEKKGEASPLGMVAGGVVGGLLGNQVGAGRGKTVATVAGAAGGAYAGKKIQENSGATKTWVVSVNFDNNTSRDFLFESDPGYRVGDPVRASGSGITRR